jgi:hypothetical protein
MDDSHRDAGCVDSSSAVEPAGFLPGTVAAPEPQPIGMTACTAAPLIQKVIA